MYKQKFSDGDIKIVKDAIEELNSYDTSVIEKYVNSEEGGSNNFTFDEVKSILRTVSNETKLHEYNQEDVGYVLGAIYTITKPINVYDIRKIMKTNNDIDFEISYLSNIMYAISKTEKYKNYVRCNKIITANEKTIYLWSFKSNNKTLDEFLNLPDVEVQTKHQPKIIAKSKPVEKTLLYKDIVTVAQQLVPSANQTSAFNMLEHINQKKRIILPNVIVYCDLDSSAVTCDEVRMIQSLFGHPIICYAKATEAGFNLNSRPQILNVVEQDVDMHIAFQVGINAFKFPGRISVFISRNDKLRTIAKKLMMNATGSHIVTNYSDFIDLINTNDTVGRFV
jgi:hypothetical protein